MKKEARQLLNCLRAYRKGETAAVLEPLSMEEWRGLYSLAHDQKLAPVVFEMLHGDPDFCNGDETLVQGWKRNAIMLATEQMARTQKLLELTQALEQTGVCYAVLKGAVCRRMYAKPDLRTSADEDLYIPCHESARCSEVFMQCGFVALREQGEHEVTHWQGPQTGLHIELHTQLFSTGWAAERILNGYFDEQLANVIDVPVEQSSVKTLEPTANLLFLIAHAMKHFIAGGFGVRTLADILTFCELHQEQIDRQHLMSMLEQIHGEVFFRKLCAIGHAYLDFDMSSWDCIPTDTAVECDLLNDMLDAGIYGQTSMDRKHSAALALQTARGDRTKPSARAALFPTASQLEGRYPILRKAPALLPVMWVHRMACYGVELLRNRGDGNSPLETLAMGRKRTEMMIKYGIIPQVKTKNR